MMPGRCLVLPACLKWAHQWDEREAPNLVISDLPLPDGDGLGIVRATRSRVSPPLAVVVSALSAEPSRRAATAVWASDFLTQAI